MSDAAPFGDEHRVAVVKEIRASFPEARAKQVENLFDLMWLNHEPVTGRVRMRLDVLRALYGGPPADFGERMVDLEAIGAVRRELIRGREQAFLNAALDRPDRG